MKATSLFGAAMGFQLARAVMSSAETKRPSSWRRRFSRRIFREKGSFATAPGADLSRASRRKISNSASRVLRVERAPKEFLMGGIEWIGLLLSGQRSDDFVA